MDQTVAPKANPAVTVLMAVHNCARFLEEALTSVAAQELTDYEFIIIDDGSTDGSSQILTDAAAVDHRIRLFRNETNIGLTRSLNIGLQHARGAYVARLDGDDICMPERLARQLAFLEHSPDHVAVACGYTLIDDHGRTLRNVDAPLDDWQIRFIAGFNPPAPHPAYFFRREVESGVPIMYDERFV
ncbi:MAG TPA: glycosyltransferase family 2 protein, partial [Afifellaceae bacterium]|nr:glycosyltransferase family 2 protein [Afifellaceae bacterium]